VLLPGSSLSFGAYVVTALVDFGVVDVAAALGAVGPSGNATQFYFNSNDGRLRLTRNDGLAFSLDGLSTAFVPLDPPSTQPTQLWALGTRADGSAVNATFGYAASSGSSFPFTTYGGLAGMTDLVSVEFRSCANGGLPCSVPTLNNGQFAIDNIAVTVVPEPHSALLMALGLAGVAGLGLRRRRGAR